MSNNQLSGYLKVKGTWGKHSKYWFVLNGTVLSRYKTPKDAAPQDALDLNHKNVTIMNAEGITGKKHSIAIFVASKSPIIILTGSDEEFHCWLSKMQAASRHSNNEVFAKDSTESVISTMEAVLEASVLTDEKCCIFGFNKAAEELFGYSKQEILGKNVTMLMPDAYAAVHDKYVVNYNKTGHKKLIGMPRQLIAKKKNGTSAPVHISLGEIAQHKSGECQVAFVALIRPIEIQIINPSTPKLLPFGFSPVLKKARAEADLDFICLDENNNNRRDSLDNLSTSATVLNQDFGIAIKAAERKMNEKIMKALQSIQHDLKEELEVLDMKYLVSQHKNDFLEVENGRLNALVGKLTDDNARLQEEITILQKESATCQILQVLHKNSTFLSFLAFCQNRKSPEQVMFYNEAELFRKKFSSMNNEENMKEAIALYNKYLIDDAPFQLNTRAALTNHVKKNLPTPSQYMFSLLQDEIVHELNHELFKEFVATAQGKYALAELGLLQ